MRLIRRRSSYRLCRPLRLVRHRIRNDKPHQSLAKDLQLELDGPLCAIEQPGDLAIGAIFQLPDEDPLEVIGKTAEQPLELLSRNGRLLGLEPSAILQLGDQAR